ncbi:hypothetical protein SAMN05421594_1807 [Chryseobacterium oleae]|uniref:Lipoprotein n=1 Tax=Chryseobacterium oleae TaxID=491207 RepID=A0A1I4XFT4_CHROL|nr:hypothetical protein [Chryseobacterium oleae]SFN24635.1 hypothetical protein SAMN05421594_1807 [Chryseobacterium oleae]
MKKIISSLCIVIIISAVSSCRQEDEESIRDFNHENSKNNVLQKNADTLNAVAVPGDKDNEVPVVVKGDPPPKNGQQWKH